MKVSDGSKYWNNDRLTNAGHTVRNKECIQQAAKDGDQPVTVEDLLWADIIIVYSYGCSSVWKLLAGNIEQLKNKVWLALAILCGVPDIFFTQFREFLWHVGAAFAKAACWDVYSVPISATIKNGVAIQVKLGEPIPDVDRVNVDCNWCALNHVTISSDDNVLFSIDNWLLETIHDKGTNDPR